MDSEPLYQKLPVFAQNWACSLEGWRIQRTRFNANFEQLLPKVEERLNWSTEQLLNYRHERLHRFMAHCFATVPYYRQLAQKRGLTANDFLTLADLAKLPILTKEVVQAHYQAFLSEVVPAGQRVMIHTSGTTGGGLRFATTLAAIQEQWAVWVRYRRLHGLEQGVWCGYFGGRSVVPLRQTKPPFWRLNRPGKQILFSAYHLSPERVPLYLAQLNERQPPWLHGYPSILALLANTMQEKELRLNYQPRWITIGAENLLPQQANLIEAVFGLKPIQHYGMAEAVANFSQFPDGNLYVDEDFAAVEFIPNPAGIGYKVIGTNFTNPATPLVRYEVGDVVDLPAEPQFGPGRRVLSVDGRQEDYIILSNGAILGRMDHIFKDMMAIREAQLYQAKPGVIIVRVVKNESYGSEDEQQLLAEFYKRVGDYAEVQIEYVPAIERTTTGKLRFVISDLKAGALVKS